MKKIALKTFGVGFSIAGVGYIASANTSFNWRFSSNNSNNKQIWAAENQWESESKKCMERLLDLRDNPAHKWEAQPDKDGIQIKRLIDRKFVLVDEINNNNEGIIVIDCWNALI